MTFDLDAMHKRGAVLHPERYAPDGTPLMRTPGVCRHGALDKQRGQCDGQASSWSHRLQEWSRRHGPEPEVPDDDDDDAMEVAHADPHWIVDPDDDAPRPRHQTPDDIPM